MNRCPYCGHRCHGRTCEHCADLARLERQPPTVADELERALPKPRTVKRRFRATCPKCHDLNPPTVWRCQSCGSNLYPTKGELPCRN